MGGNGARLDPEFRFGDVLAPYAQRFMAGELSPAAFARRLGEAGFEAAQLGLGLPEQLRRLLAAIDGEGLQLGLRSDDVGLIPLASSARTTALWQGSSPPPSSRAWWTWSSPTHVAGASGSVRC